MGLFSVLADTWESFSHPSPDAETPTPGSGGMSSEETPAAGKREESGEEEDVNKADADKQKQKSDDGGEQGHKPSYAGKDADEDEGDEEEEEEEEVQDPKGKLEEECANSRQCAPHKHHYDECVERVTGQIENEGKAKEDCVEEFFHLVHCASACAAPKLFRELK